MRAERRIPALAGLIGAGLTLWWTQAALRDPYHLPVPIGLAELLSLGPALAMGAVRDSQGAPGGLILAAVAGAIVNGLVWAGVAGGSMWLVRRVRGV